MPSMCNAAHSHKCLPAMMHAHAWIRSMLPTQRMRSEPARHLPSPRRPRNDLLSTTGPAARRQLEPPLKQGHVTAARHFQPCSSCQDVAKRQYSAPRTQYVGPCACQRSQHWQDGPTAHPVRPRTTQRQEAHQGVPVQGVSRGSAWHDQGTIVVGLGRWRGPYHKP